MSCSRRSAARRGQVLVEFALVSLVLYLLLAAILDFGRTMHSSQTLQQAADVLARELARTPLPPTATLPEALNHAEVRQRIFDERLLVIDLDQNPNPDFANFPIVNQMLRPVMIVDLPEIGGTRRRLLRYPGALVDNSNDPPGLEPPVGPDTGFRVVVPLLIRGQVTVVPVVEPLAEDGRDPFPVTSQERGVAALRLNYPFQAAALSAYRSNPNDPFRDNTPLVPLRATVEGSPPNAVVSDANPSNPLNNRPYSGPLGLGRQQAWGQAMGPVRPYRKVLSSQAVYRREIFSAPEQATSPTP